MAFLKKKNKGGWGGTGVVKKKDKLSEERMNLVTLLTVAYSHAKHLYH